MKNFTKVGISLISMMILTSLISYGQSNLLKGGNMESADVWNISVLNTPAGLEALATWNFVTDTPVSGSGGALHVTGTSNNNNVQYCIYQEISLSADSLYTFDGAIKELTGSFENSWCEVFISTVAPVDGDDFGSEVPRIAHFSFWDPCNAAGIDGTFMQNGCDHDAFVPEQTGSYYFVLKVGSTSWDGSDKTFEVILDELMLTSAVSRPFTGFSADRTVGFAPLPVKFADESVFADSWAWDFGDGTTSTDQHPTHTYAATGTYTVSLTAANEEGDSLVEKVDYIKVNEKLPLPDGEQIYGGEMESTEYWSITNLDASSIPTATWNYTDDVPASGAGGALYVTGTVNNTTSQYCIFQPVELSADSIYNFNGAFKALSDLPNFWTEVFIGAEAPKDGADYGTDQGKMISQFSWWSDCQGIAVDGTFQNDACINESFVPEESGTFYFVVKIGNTDWESSEKTFAILLDKLSLKSSASKPFTSFSADVQNGFNPLTVQFSDESQFAASWAWDFGDGANSTDQNPEHIYNAVGKYTVELTTTNDLGDSTVTKADFITVNEDTSLPEGELLYGGNMENSDLWTITPLDATTNATAEWNYSDDLPAAGEGGCLHLTATVLNSHSQYGIWQAIELDADSTYNFDGAFKDLGTINQFWLEVFIGTTPPADGADYGEGQTKIAYLNTWEGCVITDGTFKAEACTGVSETGVFVPETSGTYYFVVKIGHGEWDNAAEITYDILLDELTFKKASNAPLPEADFFADITSGAPGLAVQFTDLSVNASSWAWSFGDGSTSDQQSPSHTYTSPGTYSVELVISNGEMTDTLQKVDMISVNWPVAIPRTGFSDLVIYPNPAHGYIVIGGESIAGGRATISDIQGRFLKSVKISEIKQHISLSEVRPGVYFLKIEKEGDSTVRKLIVK